MGNLLAAIFAAIATSVSVHHRDYGWAVFFALIFIMNLGFVLLFVARGAV